MSYLLGCVIVLLNIRSVSLKQLYALDDIYSAVDAETISLKVTYSVTSNIQITCTIPDGPFAESVTDNLVSSEFEKTISISLDDTAISTGVYSINCSSPDLDPAIAMVFIVDEVSICDTVVIDTGADEVYIRKFFDTITLNQNGTFVIYLFPHKKANFTCVVYDVNIKNYAAELTLKTSELFGIEERFGTYTVFAKDSAELGVYGVKCTGDTLEAKFVFEFSDSPSCRVTSSKLNFQHYISVDCSCDVTVDVCDSRCCCDNDCSSQQVMPSS